MNIIILSAILFASCTAIHSGFGVAPAEDYGMEPAVLAGIDSVMTAGIEAGIYPGAVVSVVKQDKIVYLKSFGNRQVVPDTQPMEVSTVFDLASLSKCVGTTLAAMMLIEQKKLSLDEPVKKYIPDFSPWKDSIAGNQVDIEIQDLMTHSSGLDPEIVVPDYISRFGTPTADSLASYIAKEVKRNFEPKSDYLYSCINYLTLQIIIEKVTGKRLCDYLKENVYEPMGLDNTCYNPDEEMIPECAPTEVQDDGLPLRGVVHDPTARIINKGNSGNAGLFSNARDLSKIASMIMNGGELDGIRILSEESVRTMTSVPENNAAHIGRALGWDKYSTSSSLKGTGFSDNTVCHTGYTGTSMVIDMDSKVAVIILTNRVHPQDKGSLSKIRPAVAEIVAESLK